MIASNLPDLLMDLTPQWIGIYISLLGTAVSLMMSFHAVTEAKKARKRQAASTTAYFNFGRLLISQPWRANDLGKYMKFTGDPSPPDKFGEVPEGYPKGWPVLISGLNKGDTARQLKIRASAPLKVELHPFICGSDGLGYIEKGQELQFVYEYNPDRRGKIEKITLDFQTADGSKIRQRFLIMHGSLVTQRL